MILRRKLSLYSLLGTSLFALAACGGNESSSTQKDSAHPTFKWANAAVSNNFAPLGDISNRTPNFTWQAYSTAGQLATEYNFGHQNTNGDGWLEYTVAAAGANCATGGTCAYKPANHVFNINDQKVWWVRGRVNGAWQEWSEAHVFKVVSTTTPPTGGGNYAPSGDTATLTPEFKWPKIGTSSSYELGIETQSGSAWQSFSVNGCQSASCTFTPNHNFSVNDQLTWWVRPTAGAWSTGVDFTLTAGSGSTDTQAPTTPTALSKGATTSNSISITWNASSDNVGVTAYRIYRNGSQVGTTATTNYTDSALNPATRYTYTVRAVDAANNVSSNSQSLAVTTEAGGGGTTLKAFTWAAINNASAYTFGIERQNGTGWREYNLIANQINCQTGTCSFIPNDYGLNVGDNVVWFVKPNNGAWSSAHNSTVASTGSGTDTLAPSVPSNLQEVSATTNRVSISWNASTDNVAVTVYRVYRNGQLLGTTATTNYSDSTVAPANTYAYTVSALDAANNVSNASSALSVTTPSLPPQTSGLVINEILAGNTSVNMDTDYYKFSDWIELYNNTNSAINISGYYLSDDVALPRKWKIPAGTSLAAQDYLLIWADKKDTKASELHSNFSLSSKGETITLADRAGAVIDTLIFTKLASNVSVGKANNSLVYMDPTPEAQNSRAFSSGKQSKKPSFSNDAGFFGSRLNLQLSQENNGAVYYTNDGSTPTTSSTRYSGAISLDNTTVIKAIAIENGKLASKVVTNTYFINHQSNLPVVSLSMESAHLFDDTVGIYTVGTNGTPHVSCNNVVANYAQDWDRPVYLEYFDQNQTRAFAFGADTGVTGECSRRKAKKSFGFELDGKYGTKSLSYKLYPGKNLGKIKDFKIRTANSGYRIGDELGAQLVEEGGLDIDYQAYRAVQMFMNGEYWGVYNIREKKGAEYLESNYPNLGKVDIVKVFNVKAGDYTDHGIFNTFLASNDLSTTANYQQALTLFDEKSFMDYMAFMIYNGNLDWIGGNHRYWKEKKVDAKWRWMVDDIDWGFLSTIDFAGEGYAVDTNHFELLKSSDSNTSVVLLFNGLMKNNTFRAKFKTRFTQLLDTTFTEAFLMPILNRIDDERKDYMHLEKFAGMPASDYVASYANYIENDLRNFIRIRTNRVKQQLQNAIP